MIASIRLRTRSSSARSAASSIILVRLSLDRRDCAKCRICSAASSVGDFVLGFFMPLLLVAIFMIRRPIAVVLAHLASDGVARRAPTYNGCVPLFTEYVWVMWPVHFDSAEVYGTDKCKSRGRDLFYNGFGSRHQFAPSG